MAHRDKLLNTCRNLMLLGMAAGLSGCVGVAVRGVTSATDLAQRSSHMKAAEAGDPAAQLAVARSYCCGSRGVHDTQTATEWACRAAAQDYGPAQAMLGDLYAGRLSGGGGLIGRAVSAARTQPTRPVEAAVWYQQALRNGVQEAQEPLDQLSSSFDEDQRQALRVGAAQWSGMPCLWNAPRPAEAPG
jgi:TPR repeat protein